MGPAGFLHGFVKVRAGDEQDAPSSEISFKPLVQELKATFDTGKTKDLSWRKSQLKAIQSMIDENHEEITATVRTDYGGPKIRGLGELNAHLAAQEALSNLDKWTAPQEVPTPIVVAPTMNARSFVRQEPKGVLLVIGPLLTCVPT
jgi:aldehyde dehydrogenase (NAD+)